MYTEINTVDCYDPRWRIGLGGYNFDRMRLSMLHWVGGDYDGNTWQLISVSSRTEMYCRDFDNIMAPFTLSPSLLALLLSTCSCMTLGYRS